MSTDHTTSAHTHDHRPLLPMGALPPFSCPVPPAGPVPTRRLAGPGAPLTPSPDPSLVPLPPHFFGNGDNDPYPLSRAPIPPPTQIPAPAHLGQLLLLNGLALLHVREAVQVHADLELQLGGLGAGRHLGGRRGRGTGRQAEVR